MNISATLRARIRMSEQISAKQNELGVVQSPAALITVQINSTKTKKPFLSGKANPNILLPKFHTIGHVMYSRSIAFPLVLLLLPHFPALALNPFPPACCANKTLSLSTSAPNSPSASGMLSRSIRAILAWNGRPASARISPSRLRAARAAAAAASEEESDATVSSPQYVSISATTRLHASVSVVVGTLELIPAIAADAADASPNDSTDSARARAATRQALTSLSVGGAEVDPVRRAHVLAAHLMSDFHIVAKRPASEGGYICGIPIYS